MDLGLHHCPEVWADIAAKTRQVRLLGMASLTRSKAAPEVPTLNEAGLRDFQSTAWFALVAPPAMPAVLVDRINADVVAAMSDGDVRNSLDKIMLEPIAGSPQAAASFIAREVELWSAVIRKSRIPVQ